MKRLPPAQARLFHYLRGRGPEELFNVAPRTRSFQTARALERRGLVQLIPNRSIGGFDVHPISTEGKVP